MNNDGSSPEASGGSATDTLESPVTTDTTPAAATTAPSVTEALGSALGSPASTTPTAETGPVRVPVTEPNPPAPGTESPFKVPFTPITPGPDATGQPSAGEAALGGATSSVGSVTSAPEAGTGIAAQEQHTGLLGRLKKLITGG